MPPGLTRSAATRSSSRWSSGSGSRAPAQVGPAGEHAEARAGRVDEHAVEAGQLRRQLRRVRVHDRDVVGAEAAAVLLQLARAARMELDRDDLALELRRLPARRGAEVERALARTRADGEPGELRAAALRPDQTGGERLLVDALDVQRVRQVGIGPCPRPRRSCGG